ncbi:DNA polymerase I [Oceanidesulfovibrio indonesiensis]|uniref:DNA polymerase I n=1 Tax=Oceanidesulfovibrio indonesiensis TaxID=54767 RepID=A0A7M3MBG5_9BACT|nr:DNA polymerase I [Oceanidesulfovibrio indonesiensis]TVM15535.1 DNA polymerase I [Oceanidesulfovibrio indonesiensis]
MSLKERLGLAKDPLYLIDGSTYVYRAFYAFPDLQRADGFPTNALFIVMRLMLKLLREEEPRHMVFVLDGPGPNFRHELFEDYKAHRMAMPENLKAQLDPIKEALGLLGCPVVISEGCEADDVIAAVARKIQEDRPVVIVGADKDLRQLLTPNVLMWDPGGKQEKLVTLESFTEETGLRPDQWPDYQALIGDSSDNIPGVPGVGPKTAEKLLKRFPKLEDLVQALQGGGDLTKVERNKLKDHAEDVFLYRKLTSLDPECVDVDPSALKNSDPNIKGLARFLEEYEFRSLLREMPREKAVRVHAEELPLFGAKPADHESDTLDKIGDPEALPRMAGREVCLVPQNDGKKSVLLAVSGDEPGAHAACIYTGPVAPLADMLAAADRVFCPVLKELLRAHPEFEAVETDRWSDLSVAAYLLEPEERDYSLPHLLQRYEPELPTRPQDLARGGLDLGRLLDQRLEAAQMPELFRDLEMPLVTVLAAMERCGVAIDLKAFAEFLDEVTTETQTLHNTIMELAGKEFNPRSSQQLAEVLFTDLGLKPAGKTPGGSASTSQAVLERMADKHPIISTILEYRKMEKLRSTYLEPLPKLLDPKDGRIHTTFNQTSTATGRLSSSSPNLQNIPIRGPLGSRMRSCFIAGPGHLLVAADYSQIELRVLAHMSQDPTLLEAFRKNEDIHSRTAGLLFDRSPDQVSADERRSAKTINFGLIYGMGPQKLAQELSVSLKDAKAFIERYFSRLSVLRDFYESIEETAREQGYVTTLAKRRRLLPDLYSRNTQLQSQARRQAINTVVQGSAADIIKLAMLAVARDDALQSLDARLILQVHDELLLEVPAGEGESDAKAREAGTRLETLMAGVVDLDVPLLVEWGVGRDWAAAH